MFRVEKCEKTGHFYICGSLIPDSEIIERQKWISSSGSIVMVVSIDSNGVVTYQTDQGEIFERDSFGFQSRYCLIIGKE